MSTTQKGETPCKFGDRTGGFKVIKPNGFTSSSVPTSGLQRKALAALTCAGADGITQMDFTPSWRLAAVIFQLRRRGWVISTAMVPVSASRRVARYVLRGWHHE